MGDENRSGQPVGQRGRDLGERGRRLQHRRRDPVQVHRADVPLGVDERVVLFARLLGARIERDDGDLDDPVMPGWE